MTKKQKQEPDPGELASRCHEVQVGLGRTEIPEFELLVEVGMAVRLALHIRGLPNLRYDTLRLVANHYLEIPSVAVKRIIELLAEIEFVRLNTQGATIKTVLPNVPYYKNLYETLGEYAKSRGFNEAETLTLEIVRRLARSPEKLDSLQATLGAPSQLFKRAVTVGESGSYLIRRRARGRDILLNPTYFSENADTFADLVAGGGATSIRKVLGAVRSVQGIPLSIVERRKEIGGVPVADEELAILRRLAEDGAVKPPSIKTTYAGENYFLFTPAPSGAALPPTKREIYEKAMAIVSAVRQGQFLPNRYAIRSPGAVLYTLKSRLKLSRATTEATQQYRNLVHLRVGRLVPVGASGYSELHVIETEENKEALELAYDLIESGASEGIEVDEEARNALQQDQEYIESMVASGELRKRQHVKLGQAQQLELDLLIYGDVT